MKPSPHLIFRQERVIEVCANKSVLHLGFIQHAHLYREKIREGNWLHQKISAVSSRLVGLDYLASDVETIQKEFGYESYYADVTKLEELDLDEKFDVIVCGELIEHIDNAGLMLDGIKRFMHENSILIITTPNPWYRYRLQLLENNILEDQWLNKEHTCWYSFGTLSQFLERKGYQEVKYDYYYMDSLGELIREKTAVDKVKTMVRLLVSKRRKKQFYDGLFFLAKLSK